MSKELRVAGARKKRQAVIFDFDGTIADSFDYVFDFIWNESPHRLNRPSAEERMSYRDMSMKSMARKAGISAWKLIPLYFRGRRTMRSNMPNIQPFEGMPEQIKLLHEKGFGLHIVSSNSRRNIRRFLKEKDLPYFTSIHAGANMFGKKRLFRRALQRAGAEAANSWGVGDQRRDAADAHSLGIRTIGVTWGFDDLESLQRHADVVVDKPEGIGAAILGAATIDS